MAVGMGPETTVSEANLESVRAEVDLELIGFLDEELDRVPPHVAAPLRHAVLAPGKRIRPLLVVASYGAARGQRRRTAGDGPAVALLACSVELVHTYSLIHDDLPCMDDDLLRRGRPTLHVEFDVQTAILAGAALMPLAVRAITKAGARLDLEAHRVARLVQVMTVAAGGAGMVGGQLRDLDAEGRGVTREELEGIHLGKTARLIAAACVMGAVAAGAPPPTERRLEGFGRHLGLAFQVVDDILDVTGSATEMGKAGGRDAALGKATVPSIIGLAEAHRLRQGLAERALSELSELEEADQLRAITRLVVERNS
jgi:geranylgeranyl pyrophosphate synthase